MSAPTLSVEQTLEAAGVRIFSRSGAWLRIAATWRGGVKDSVGVRKDTGRWRDHAAGEKGSWTELKKRLGIDGEPVELPPNAPAAQGATDPTADPDAYVSSRREIARRTWDAGYTLTGAHEQKILNSNRSRRQKAKALAGTASRAILWAREYLESRGPGVLEAAIHAGVRVLPTTHKSSWHPVRKERMPCLLWPVRDPKRGGLVAVQREWGRGHDNKRSIAGHILPIRPGSYETHGAGFVFPPTRRVAEPTLYVVEGQVSGAAMAAAHPDAWVLVLFDLNGISVPPRPVIEAAITKGAHCIVMAGDPGDEGEKHALQGIRKMQEWGLKVRLEWTVPQSPERDQDWADILEQGGHEAVRAAAVVGIRDIPHQTPKTKASVAHIKNWRKKERERGPVEGLPVEQARAVLEKGLRATVDAYLKWLEPESEPEQDEGVNDNGKKKRKKKKSDKIAPLAIFKVTTGVGKTTLLKDLIHDARLMAAGAVRVFVPDHSQAAAYEAAGWFHYWGRNPDPSHCAYCPNHADMMKAVEQKHNYTQAMFCRTCPNGLKWALDFYEPGSERWGAAQNALLKEKFSPEEIEDIIPCRWQTHLRDALAAQAVVACSASYSDPISKYGESEEESIDSLTFFDEGASLSDTILVTHQDISFWAARAIAILKNLEKRSMGADMEDYRKSLTDAQPLFSQLAASLSKMVGKSGRINVDPALAEVIDKLLEARGKRGETAAWEALDFGPKGVLRHAPLRAAWAIAESLKYGGGRVEDGAIIVAASKPIVSRVGRLPMVFCDTTPDPVTLAICRANGACEINAIAFQDVYVVRYPTQFFGHGAWCDDADPSDRAGAIAKHKALLGLFPESGHIWMKRARLGVDSESEDTRIRHWGGGHRAHNDFSGKNLCLVGGHFTPEHGWSAAWQGARIAALAAGADPADWPEQPDGPIETAEHMDIDEGGAWVESRHPLPVDQRMREFFLRLSTCETVQAIGRNRGANNLTGKPYTIRIFGGMPLFGLEEHGLHVDRYEVDPEEIQGARIKRALRDRQAVAQALADGCDRTINAVRDWIKERTGKAPGIERTRTFLRELEATARAEAEDIKKVFVEVSTKADSYLSEADGRLDRAAAIARTIGDLGSALLLGLADLTERGDGADPEDEIESTGPPVAA